MISKEAVSQETAFFNSHVTALLFQMVLHYTSREWHADKIILSNHHMKTDIEWTYL
ncbi:MAG: hypothetical protein Q8862_08630 [Bacteroidota bacterium]|nr:hypothetical protein [Bacteroidota bacterium]